MEQQISATFAVPTSNPPSLLATTFSPQPQAANILKMISLSRNQSTIQETFYFLYFLGGDERRISS
jgi:hypothetical protein